jgi:hypothetical protein
MLVTSSERFVGIGLAVYLLPAFLIVLLIASLGLLVLAAGRAVAELAWRRACHLRATVGPEVFRS